MTGTKIYDINGAKLTATVNIYPTTASVSFCLDLSDLDKNEPEHSRHNLIGYVKPLLPLWKTRDSFWWNRLYHAKSCKTGSQARRIIQSTLARLDDIISQAQIARTARKSEMEVAFR